MKRLALAVTALVTATASSGRSADWPQWRGPDRSDVSQETGLLKSWPEGGPKRLWLFRDAGVGYSGFAVVGNRLFTMGGRKDVEELFAVDIAEGKELWAAAIGAVRRDGRGDGPRGTPSVDGDRVYGMGGQGTLVCVETADGKVNWRTSMKDLGGSTPGWGFSESVLVDGDRVLCTPGGSQGAVAALDKTTGKLLWQSKEFTDAAQYASIVPAEIHGKRQYVQLTMKSLAGIAAEDGKLLWKSPWPGQTAVVPTPIVRGDLIYITSGYGVGSKLVHVSEKLSASDRWSNKVMKNHHGGVILVGEHVYGHSDGAGWVCQDFKSGEMVWSERRKLGKGAVACAGGRLYCLDESDGTVVLIEASPESWKEHGRFRLDPQSEVRSSRGRIWTHPVISSGRLYLRDQDLVYCYDVREG